MRNRRWLLASLTGCACFLGMFLAGPGAFPAAEGTPKAESAPSGPPAQFILRLKPIRAQGEASQEERAKITQHFEYLKGLLAAGNLVLSGLSTDDYQEIVVIQARDRLDAERIMASDPAVGGNVYLAELHPFHVVFMAGGK